MAQCQDFHYGCFRSIDTHAMERMRAGGGGRKRPELCQPPDSSSSNATIRIRLQEREETPSYRVSAIDNKKSIPCVLLNRKEPEIWFFKIQIAKCLPLLSPCL